MASNSIGQLSLDLSVKNGAFIEGMDKAARNTKKRVKDMERTLKDFRASLIKTVAGFGVAFSVGSVFNSIIQNTRDTEKEQAQLAAVIESTGKAAGFTKSQLNDMAGALSGKSIFSTGEINQAQTTLLAFTGVIGDQFIQAQQAAIDMASRTGMSVTQAAEKIGRALDVPSQGMGALSKEGFKFNEEQKKLAKQLESMGRTAEAQGIILEELKKSYEGAAQAARNTFGGALDALKNNINGLLTGQDGSLEGARLAIESLNEKLSDPAVADAFGKVITGVAKAAGVLVEAFTAISWEHATDAAKVLAFAIGAKMLVATGVAAKGFKTLAMEAYNLKMAQIGAGAASISTASKMQMMGAASIATAKSMGTTTLAARTMTKAFAMLGGPIGIAITAATSLLYFSTSTSDVKDHIVDLLDPLDQLINKFDKLDDVARKKALREARDQVRDLEKEYKRSAEGIATHFETIANSGNIGFMFDLQVLNKETKEVMYNIAAIAQEAAKTGKAADFSKLTTQLEQTKGLSEENKKQLLDMIASLSEMSSKVDTASSALNQLNGAQLKASIQSGRFTNELIKAEAAAAAASPMIGMLTSAMHQLWASMNPKSVSKEILTGSEAAVKYAKKLNEALEDKQAVSNVAKLGLEIQRNVGEWSKATEAQYQSAYASAQAADAYEANEKAQKAAADGAKKHGDELKRQAEKAAQARKVIEDQITALKVQKETHDMSSRALAIYNLEQKGATAEDIKRANALLDLIAVQERQDKFKDLAKQLRTPNEQLNDTLREQFKIIDESNASLAEREKYVKRAIDGVFSFDKAPKFADDDTFSGKMLKFGDAENDLEKWYQEQLELIDTWRQEKADRNAEWDEKELKVKKYHEDQLAAIESARQEVQLAAASEVFGNMSGLAKTFMGEQSTTYRALFALEKSYALAKVLMNAPKTASDAMQAMSGIPVVGPALGAVAAAAAIAYQATQAAGISAIGMAHDGIDSIPKTGTWILEKGERVLTSQTSAKLDAALERIHREREAKEIARNTQQNITQHINVTGSVDNHTANQIAQQTSRRQRMINNRFG